MHLTIQHWQRSQDKKKSLEIKTMTGWLTRLSSPRCRAWHWKSLQSCFGGWWKHSSGNPSNKPNPVVAWAETAGAYRRLCVLSCCLRKLSLRLLCNTPLRYLWADHILMPNTILRLWIVGHFPTRSWFDSGCGAIWLGNVRNVLHLDFYSGIQCKD